MIDIIDIYDKYIAKEAELRLEALNKDVKKKIKHIEKVEENWDKVFNEITVNQDWFDSEEKGKGKWIINEIEKLKKGFFSGEKSILDQIEKIKNTEIKGDQSIIDQIEKIQNGKYTTQAQVDNAKNTIKQLSKQYDASAEANLKTAQAEIDALAKEYNSQVQNKIDHSTSVSL